MVISEDMATDPSQDQAIIDPISPPLPIQVEAPSQKKKKNY